MEFGFVRDRNLLKTVAKKLNGDLYFSEDLDMLNTNKFKTKKLHKIVSENIEPDKLEYSIPPLHKLFFGIGIKIKYHNTLDIIKELILCEQQNQQSIIQNPRRFVNNPSEKI